MREETQIREVPLEVVWQIRNDVLWPERSLESVKLADDEAGIHLGVYVNGRPVSVISFFRQGSICRFRKFATYVDQRGKGYGSKLLEHIIQLAESSQATVIWCNARTAALRLYERFGMKSAGEPWEENGYSYVKMEKKLV